MRRRSGLFTAFLCLFTSAEAQVLDTTFGANGRAVLEFGGTTLSATSAVLQSDGKIVVLGNTPAVEYLQPANSSRDFLVARFNNDGTLDTGFSGDGIATVDFEGTDDRPVGIAQQPDGKLVVAGYSTSMRGDTDFTVARLLANGTLDTAFNGAGKQSINFQCVIDNGLGVISTIDYSAEFATSLAIQPDGKILIAGGTCGASPGNNLALVRLQTNGSIDTGYGSQGTGRVTVTGVGPVTTLDLAPDGRLFVVLDLSTRYGWVSSNGATVDIAEVLPSAPPDAVVFAKQSAVRIPNGDYIVGGLGISLNQPQPNPVQYKAIVTRIGSTLYTDMTFADNGFFTDPTPTVDSAVRSVLLEPGGKIVASGFRSRGSEDTVHDAAVLRLHADGTVDHSFGTDGLRTVSFPDGATEYSFIPSTLLRSGDGGKLIFVGTRGVLTLPEGKVFVTGTQRIALARVHSTPQFSLTQASASVSEGAGSVVLNVTRTGITNGAVSVNYATQAGTAAAGDFTAASGTLTWQPGDADAKSVTITLTNDTSRESNEQFAVTLSNPSEGSIGEKSTAVTITDDESQDSSDGGGGGALDGLSMLVLLLSMLLVGCEKRRSVAARRLESPR